MIECVHDVNTRADGTAIIHIIGDVVQMEQPIHEIATDAELWEGGIWVAPGS